jgi:ribonuclease J
MPVHGEFRMLDAQARLAREAGVPAENIVLAENGSVVELSGGTARIVDHVATGATFVDGLGVGDVREASLKDRRHLSEDGVLIVVVTIGGRNGRTVLPPELIARGFSDPGPVFEEAREEVENTVATLLADGIGERKLLEEHVHEAVGRLVYERTRRRPMILPVVVEV